LPLTQRLSAIEKYRQAGGAHADEALGALLYMGRELGRAGEALAAAQAKTGSLRLRNYSRAVALASAGAPVR
jgi:hypothetical protein